MRKTKHTEELKPSRDIVQSGIVKDASSFMLSSRYKVVFFKIIHLEIKLLQPNHLF